MIGMVADHPDHHLQVPVNLLLAAAWQDGYNGSSIQTLLLDETREALLVLDLLIHRIDQWIAMILSFKMVLPIKTLFKGKDDEHLIHISLYLPDARLLPGPY